LEVALWRQAGTTRQRVMAVLGRLAQARSHCRFEYRALSGAGGLPTRP
jgi:hypothetical protein